MALPGLLGLTAGLCTIFVLVVMVAEAWVENAQRSGILGYGGKRSRGKFR